MCGSLPPDGDLEGWEIQQHRTCGHKPQKRRHEMKRAREQSRHKLEQRSEYRICNLTSEQNKRSVHAQLLHSMVVVSFTDAV